MRSSYTSIVRSAPCTATNLPVRSDVTVTTRLSGAYRATPPIAEMCSGCATSESIVPMPPSPLRNASMTDFGSPDADVEDEDEEEEEEEEDGAASDERLAVLSSALCPAAVVVRIANKRSCPSALPVMTLNGALSPSTPARPAAT